MRSEFDAAKDAVNVDKHGVSLGFGSRLFADPDMLLVPTVRIEDGERRLKAIGVVGGKLWTAVHVVRAETVRFTSVRRSNRGEQRLYYRA